AEVDKAAGRGAQVALAKGRYAVKKRLTDGVLLMQVGPRERGEVVVADERMQNLAFEDDYAKGSPVALETHVDKPARWAVSTFVGGQLVLDTVTNGNLFPAVPLVGVDGRLRHVFGQDLMLSLDVAAGAVPSERTVTGALGVVHLPLVYSEVQGGIGALYEWNL